MLRFSRFATLWRMRRPSPRLEAWKTLYRRYPAVASVVCDKIVREQPVPQRLLDRLAVTLRREAYVAGKAERGVKPVRFDD